MKIVCYRQVHIGWMKRWANEQTKISIFELLSEPKKCDKCQVYGGGSSPDWSTIGGKSSKNDCRDWQIIKKLRFTFMSVFMFLKVGEFLLLMMCGRTSPSASFQRKSPECDFRGFSPLFLASIVWEFSLMVSRMYENAFFIHFLDFVLVVYLAIFWSITYFVS